jgi:hypothetical protein
MLLVCAVAGAQDYTPDVAEFDGESTLEFDPSPAFWLGDGGSIEFWVAADWESEPGYDPVILSNAGSQGASYLIAVLRDRSGLGLRAGDAERYVAFDFSDGQLHHVALSYLEGALAVLIDGQVRGQFALQIDDLPMTALWVATADGNTGAFRGAIAGLRFWRVPLSQADLVTYATQDITADNVEHPAFDYLAAFSDFRNDEIIISEAADIQDEATDDE